MKYITRSLKGSFGYIRKQSIFEIFKTLLLFAMALGIFFIGYYTLGTKKSLWSIIAVLGLLPASKSLVGTIMLLRFKSINADVYKKISNCVGNIPVLYENILTTTSKTYYLPVITFCKGSLCMYYSGDINDSKSIENHMNDVLKKGGYKGITVKVYCDLQSFLQRMDELNSHFDGDSTVNADAILTTIKAVSL